MGLEQNGVHTVFRSLSFVKGCPASQAITLSVILYHVFAAGLVVGKVRLCVKGAASGSGMNLWNKINSRHVAFPVQRLQSIIALSRTQEKIGKPGRPK